MYDHEHRERKNNGEIKHVAMPLVLSEFEAHNRMRGYLTGRGLHWPLAKSNGWYPCFSKGAERIVIPCINSHGFNYWQARAMDDNPLRYDSPAIPRKDSIVFLFPHNYSNDHPGHGTVVITEGPMDALAAAEFCPAIAVMGASPSEEVIQFIDKKTRQLGLDKIVLIPDQDNYVGLLEAFSSAGMVERLQMVLPKGAKDLAAMPRWERSMLLKDSLCLSC